MRNPYMKFQNLSMHGFWLWELQHNYKQISNSSNVDLSFSVVVHTFLSQFLCNDSYFIGWLLL